MLCTENLGVSELDRASEGLAQTLMIHLSFSLACAKRFGLAKMLPSQSDHQPVAWADRTNCPHRLFRSCLSEPRKFSVAWAVSFQGTKCQTTSTFYVSVAMNNVYTSMWSWLHVIRHVKPHRSLYPMIYYHVVAHHEDHPNDGEFSGPHQ